MRDLSGDTPDRERSRTVEQPTHYGTRASRVVRRQAFERNVDGRTDKDFKQWAEEQEAWWDDGCPPGFVTECNPPQPGEGW